LVPAQDDVDGGQLGDLRCRVPAVPVQQLVQAVADLGDDKRFLLAEVRQRTSQLLEVAEVFASVRAGNHHVETKA
jgi:hypothetical protein